MSAHTLFVLCLLLENLCTWPAVRLVQGLRKRRYNLYAALVDTFDKLDAWLVGKRLWVGGGRSMRIETVRVLLPVM